MEFIKRMPLAAIIVVSVMMFSCKPDPWTSGQMPTDKVAITKTVRVLDKEKQEDKALKGQVGVVKISHRVHESQGLKCIDCHHKNIKGKNANPAREKKCATCHYGDNGYETMHGLCVDCHIKRKAGPQQCKECH